MESAPLPTPWARHDAWLVAGLAALCALLYLPLLGDYPLDNRGEPREGLMTQEILARGDWLLPRANGTRWPEKPVLFPWLAALSSLAFGGRVDEWSLRFPSAVLGGLGVVLAYLLGRRLGGRREAGLSAFVLAVAVSWISLARRARIDMSLAVLIEAAMYCLLRAYQSSRRRGVWGIVAGGLLGLATLAKGPIGVVFPVGALLGWLGLRALLDRPPAHAVADTAGAAPAGPKMDGLSLALQREARVFWEMRPVSAGALFVLVAGAWYLPAALAGGPEFRYVNLWKENIGMPLGLEEGGGHQHPFWWYLPYLLFVFLPWSLFLPAALASSASRALRRPTAEELFPLAWALIFFSGLSVAAGKRPDYLVILFPALALLVGRWLFRALSAPERHRWSLQFPIACLGLALLVGSLGLASLERLPVPLGTRDARVFGLDALAFPARKNGLDTLLDYRAPLLTLGLCLAVVSAACLLLLRRGRAAPAAGTFALTALAGAFAGAFYFFPAARENTTLKPFAHAVRSYLGPEDGSSEIALLSGFTFALPFYLQRRLPPLSPEPDRVGARSVLEYFAAPTGKRRFCILTQPRYDEFKRELGTGLECLAKSDVETEQGRYLLLGPAGTKPLSAAGGGGVLERPGR
ncbi:MAG: glycosyltransferase family 39 protein [Planctomycetes bacterium]|nr:glycosyltransferase family 39 protein [Planctomycetota bacterium]